MTEEQCLRQRIAELQRLHQQELEPLFRRLVEIEGLKPPPPLVVTLDMARVLGLDLKIEGGR